MRYRVSDSRHDASKVRSAFTLVELLVVIAIIGVLVALLLPAVQAAREAARRSECANKLKQFGLGALNHENAHQVFPSGGWGWRWTGDPDRGYGEDQPGGWYFNLLEFVELANVRQLGTDGDAEVISQNQKIDSAQRQRSAIALFVCPSRRGADQYPYTHSASFYNSALVTRNDVVGRDDYAGCAGSKLTDNWAPAGPGSHAAAANYRYGSYQIAEDVVAGRSTRTGANGIIVARGGIRIAQVTDGTSNTIIFGEKRTPSDHYDTGSSPGNDQGWDMGFDHDIIRYTDAPPQRDSFVFPQPKTRVSDANPSGHSKVDINIFGSAHPTGIQFAFADGSVHTVSFDVDLEVYRALGSRNGGEVVSLENL